MRKSAPCSIALPCPGCGRRLTLIAGGAGDRIDCARCGEAIPLAGGPAPSETAPDTCHVCGSRLFYWQKDFNQKIGCALVALGAALVPWTYGISLAVLALVDLIFYRILPRVSVCYICKARYRGLPPSPDHGPFDLVTAQTYEARSLNWAGGKIRPAVARPGSGDAPRIDG